MRRKPIPRSVLLKVPLSTQAKTPRSCSESLPLTSISTHPVKTSSKRGLIDTMSFESVIPLDVEAVSRKLRDLTASPDNSDALCHEIPDLDAARANAQRIFDNFFESRRQKSRTNVRDKQTHSPIQPKPFTIADYYAKRGPIWRPQWMTEALKQNNAADTMDSLSWNGEIYEGFLHGNPAIPVLDFKDKTTGVDSGPEEEITDETLSPQSDIPKVQSDRKRSTLPKKQSPETTTEQCNPASRARYTVWQGRLRWRPPLAQKDQNHLLPTQPHKALLHRTRQPAKIAKQHQSPQFRRKGPRNDTAAKALKRSAPATPIATNKPQYTQRSEPTDISELPTISKKTEHPRTIPQPRNAQVKATKDERPTRVAKDRKRTDQRTQQGSTTLRKAERPTGIVKCRKSSRRRT